MALTDSGPVKSQFHGQLIKDLNIRAHNTPGIGITHNDVSVINCVIRFDGDPSNDAAMGIYAHDCANTIIGNQVDVAQVQFSGPHSNNINRFCILFENVSATGKFLRPKIRGTRVHRGARLIKLVGCSGGGIISNIEMHRVTGMDETTNPDDYGGNAIQLDNSPGWTIQDFSYEEADVTGLTPGQSWTEDLLSLFHSNDCIVQRGYLQHCNSPSGDNFIAEGSLNAQVSDVDATSWSNSAFGFTDGGTGSLINCRAKNGSLTGYDGRGAPSSNGLMITVYGPGPVNISNFQYYNPANPNNLIWDDQYAPSAQITKVANFAARSPIRVVLPA
jgi:hypothetical protein